MSFKEIFEAWERGKHSKNTDDSTRKMQETWLESHAIIDKDSEVNDKVQHQKGMSRKELERIPIDESLDLHGCTIHEAELLLDQFFAKAVSRNWCKVCIIHGKGNHSKTGAVLAKFVKNWLESCPQAGRTMQAPQHLGGSGAVIVFIKQ
ncbi:MAG TPA: Smr/MutS family protein [Spirochaetia bacterium]|nr:Smr/MutS family protein [Spirochaetales bacterium]HRS66345.1 Smr/MutS family protein [Spirochaetia bacterium]HOT59073.1 Smr/MutS family protein [Spirochaetales bacterium]HPD80301.1 Smr/MutS family protein [Spirochaetales bacterium]HQG40633.1 Smr/MutS family protein [Spirochaetales bacterium]